MQAYELQRPLTTDSLKRKSRSPSPQPHKRRPSASYTPSIYADLTAWPPGPPRTLSSEAVAGSPSLSSTGVAPSTASGGSTPADWLQRTRELHIQSPQCITPAAPDDAMQSEGGSDAPTSDHNMMQTDDQPSPESYFSAPPRPAGPLSIGAHASAASDPLSFLGTSSALLSHTHGAPHEPPPLHQHLAGSPPPPLQPSGFYPGPPSGPETMSRSASADSVQSIGSAAACGMEEDRAMLAQQSQQQAYDSSPRRQQQQPVGGARGQGGWKVTMGYRSDCERCLRQERGHSTHVVWST